MKRDFSEQQKQNLLNMVKEVQPDGFFQTIGDWFGDRGMSISKFFGGYNINDYLNKMNTYHRAMIDKDNVSAQKIEEIFINVAAIDLRYSGYLSDFHDLITSLNRLLEQHRDAIDINSGSFCIPSSFTTLQMSTKYNIYKLRWEKGKKYGADQGDMAHNKKGMWFFGFRWFEDEKLFAYIRSKEKYKNYTQTKIANLTEEINTEGCGYVAVVNNIYIEFQGREEEFERVFGFPMYDENGTPNYDYLIVDIYESTDNEYYLNENYGAAALVNDIILDYLDDQDAFERKYGCRPIMDDGTINPEARQIILDEYQGQDIAEKDAKGLTILSMENRVQHYMVEKGITCESELSNALISVEEIEKKLDEGKNVNLLVSGFNLYDENGNIKNKDVGGHWMTITDTTPDGRYVVTSWGEKYYIDPSQLNDGVNYYITDIHT